MAKLFTREAANMRNGAPRVAHFVLCKNHDYVTFAGDCECSAAHHVSRFAIVGTNYGYVHTSAGEMRLWASRSGAAHKLKNLAEI